MDWKRDMTSFHSLVHFDQVLSVVVVGTYKVDTAKWTAQVMWHQWFHIMIEYLSVTDDVVVDFCGNSLNFIHVLTYISSSFDINENLWTSDHFVKIKDWASTVCGPQIHSVEAYRWIPILRRKVRNWKHRSRR